MKRITVIALLVVIALTAALGVGYVFHWNGNGEGNYEQSVFPVNDNGQTYPTPIA